MTTQTTEAKVRMLVIWLAATAVCIMFAVRPMFLTRPSTTVTFRVIAVLTGLVLYWIVARNIPGGPGDE